MTRMTAGLLVAGLVCGLAATTRAQSPPSDACRQGYVWREAVPDDHVCVTPAIRQQAAEDNAKRAPGASRAEGRTGRTPAWAGMCGGRRALTMWSA